LTPRQRRHKNENKRQLFATFFFSFLGGEKRERERDDSYVNCAIDTPFINGLGDFL
jgi:hypothetical protein